MLDFDQAFMLTSDCSDTLATRLPVLVGGVGRDELPFLQIDLDLALVDVFQRLRLHIFHVLLQVLLELLASPSRHLGGLLVLDELAGLLLLVG